MQEHQRQELLQAMGVAVLLPRFAFVGAKASTILAPVALAKNDSASRQALVSSDATTTEKPAVEAKDSPPLISLKDIVALSSENQSAVEKKTVRKSTLRYRHRIIACEGAVFVLDQPELEWQQADKKLLFIGDIYQALFAKNCESFKQENFAWPIPGVDDDHAKATEQAFIQSLAGKHQAKLVMLFSKELTALLADNDNKLHGLPCISLHSIEHYWQQPLAKAELWQSIQAAGKILAGS